MRKLTITTALLGCAGYFLQPAVAHANLLVDSSFETSAPAANNAARLLIGSTAMLGWTVVNNNGSTTDNGNDILWIGNGGYGLSTPFGNDFIDLTGDTDRAPYDGVTQWFLRWSDRLTRCRSIWAPKGPAARSAALSR